MEVKKMGSLTSLFFCALCCAITSVLAMISFKIGPVPITMATVGVYLAGGLLGPRLGALSQVLYLILIAVGVPVTASFSSGLSCFFGPTGGYLFGYVFMAFITGFFYSTFKSFRFAAYTSVSRFFWLIVACVIATPFCYGMGMAWYMIITKTDSFIAAFSVCVLPFLIGDFLKICLVSFLVVNLENILRLN